MESYWSPAKSRMGALHDSRSRTTHSAVQEENNDTSGDERGRELIAAKLCCLVNNNSDHVHIYSGTYLLTTVSLSLSVLLARPMVRLRANLLSKSLIERKEKSRTNRIEIFDEIPQNSMSMIVFIFNYFALPFVEKCQASILYICL